MSPIAILHPFGKKAQTTESEAAPTGDGLNVQEQPADYCSRPKMHADAGVAEGLEPCQRALEAALVCITPASEAHPRALEVILEEDLRAPDMHLIHRRLLCSARAVQCSVVQCVLGREGACFVNA